MDTFAKESVWKRLISISRPLFKSVHFFYRKFLEPKSEAEDERRREFILNIILVSSLVLLVFLDLTVLIQSLTERSYRGIGVIPFSLIVAVFFGVYILSRRGWFVLASYIFVAIYFCSTTYTALRWGVDLPSVLLGYVIVIIIASILVSTRFGFIITLLTAGALSVIGGLQIRMSIVPEYYWRTHAVKPNDIVEFVITFFIIMTISWLSNREIERSLRRARASEAALKAERDLLEVKVNQRGRELQEIQAQQIAELHRNAESGRLAAGFFHDLMNPLTAIALSIQQLKGRAPSGSQISSVESSLEQALVASKRMESFIGAIRKQNRRQDSKAEFSLNEEINQVLKLLDYKARTLNVKLIFTETPEMRSYGKSWQFYQVVNNLISNAIDSYENFDLADKRRKEVIVQLSEHHGRARLVVYDDGPGIPKDLQNKVFEPFYSTKPEHKGTGIGLAIVKTIIEQDFHGTIKVESDGFSGTTFIVEFGLVEVPKK